MEKLKNKLAETEGATFLGTVVLFLAGMVFFAILFEFVRVKLVVANVKTSYERAVRTVASENYNEVYAGFREEVSAGGQYSGGPEGGGDEQEVPEWEPLHDNGDIENELAELLDLEEENGKLASKESGYSLSNFRVSVKDASDSSLHRYEIAGQLKVNVTFSVAGIAASSVELPVKIQTKYAEKY